MAKNKKNIDSFNGFTFGTAEEVKTNGAQKTEAKPKTAPSPIVHEQETVKSIKRGRPKVNRETKKRISFTILPSLYERASEIAYEEGKSMSELISDFLIQYIEEKS